MRKNINPDFWSRNSAANFELPVPMIKLVIELVAVITLDDTRESLEYSNLAHTLDTQSIDVNLANWTDNKESLVDSDTLALKQYTTVV